MRWVERIADEVDACEFCGEEGEADTDGSVKVSNLSPILFSCG